jgi:DNA-directed RNA polymerase specialized sigma24 family protein
LVSEEELGDLFRRYASYVATIGIRLLGRDDELDDLVQEVFIEAYRGLHQLRSADAAKAWLARITVRRATRRLSSASSRCRRAPTWSTTAPRPRRRRTSSRATG